QVAPHYPHRAALLEVRQSLAHGPPLDAGVVAHPLADEHRTLVEQTWIAGGVEPAARLPVADRVGLELGAVAIDVRLTPQRDGAVALHEHRGRHVLRAALPLALAGRVRTRVRGRKATGRHGRPPER